MPPTSHSDSHAPLIRFTPCRDAPVGYARPSTFIQGDRS
jgi:hypothetical protein